MGFSWHLDKKIGKNSCLLLSSNLSNDASTKIAGRVCGNPWKSPNNLQGTHLLLLTLRPRIYIWCMAVGWFVVKERSILDVWCVFWYQGLKIWKKGRKKQEAGKKKESMQKKRKENNLDQLGDRGWWWKLDSWGNEQDTVTQRASDRETQDRKVLWGRVDRLPNRPPLESYTRLLAHICCMSVCGTMRYAI